MNDAENSVIYVNIGVASHDVTEILLDTFKDLKQCVVWETSKIQFKLPSNVQICRKSASKLILSKKNTALCITNEDSVTIKQALYYGVPILIIPSRNNKVRIAYILISFWKLFPFLTIIFNPQIHFKTSFLGNMSTMHIEKINKLELTKKLNHVLNNKNLKAHAEEIATLLRNKSVNLLNNTVLNEESIKCQSERSQHISQNHLHLDALGALFFVILVVVKLSLKCCRIFNNFAAESKKTK